jgi:ribosomal protein L25 (general stress protein Ctc)
MGVNGQHHAPAALYPPGKDPRYPLYVQEAEWAQTQRPEEKSSASVGDRTPVVQSVVRHNSY